MSPASDDPADATFQVAASAKGHGDLRMVVQGTQHNVQNNYYIDSRDGSAHLRPFDLPNLRLWIDRIAADYRRAVAGSQREISEKEVTSQQREIDGLRQSVAGQSASVNGKAAVRRLLAGGVAQYLSRAGVIPDEAIPEQMTLDIIVFALWPVLEAPKLPATWQQDLAELTSPRVAVITASARKARAAGNSVDVETFVRTLSAKPVRHAVLNLFEDLSDPRRGGAALTAIALASGLPKPPRAGGAKVIATWAFGAVATSVIGGAAYEIGAGTAGPTDQNTGGHEHHHDRGGGALDHLVHDFLRFF